ncbi:hypothetical protein [Hoeflea alexandrii]|uniref:hypothetical protein n=1 Tax=Hoeflea alexandrii TaxID=288436 RepID=UPI0022B0415A|nr:hypothetical protein [Hoeflea alexandrii]MCZ4287555.1 hypothetical protein [Hoeflea alexandrii]
MSTTLLSFRMFGRFHWPPLNRAIGEPAGDLRDGCVEIHYHQAAEGEPYYALMRWLAAPENHAQRTDWIKQTRPVGDLEAIRSLPYTDDEDLAEIVEGGDFSLWLNKPPAAPAPNPHTRPRLSFFGGTVFDQFDDLPDYTAGPYPKPTLRWPLVPEVAFGGRHSGIIFGQRQSETSFNHNFRISLNLPSPLAPDGTLNEAGAVRFSGVFKPEAGARNDCGALSILAVDGDDSTHSLPSQYNRFGRFNLSDGASDMAKGYVSTGATRFWGKARPDLATLLEACGAVVTEKKSTREITGGDETTRSLRFGDDNGDLITIRRIAFKANGLRLNLPREGVSDFTFPADTTLKADIELASAVSDEAIAGDIRAPGAFSLRVHWLWKETISDAAGAGMPRTFKEASSDDTWFERALHNAIVSMHQTRLALQTVRDEQPASFLPELSVEKGGKVLLTLVRSAKVQRNPESGTVLWGEGNASTRNPADGTQRLRLSLAPPLLPGDNASRPVFRAYFPGFQAPWLPDPKNPYDHHHLEFGFDEQVYAEPTGRSFAFFRISEREDASKHRPRFSGRLGSLTLDRAADRPLLRENIVKRSEPENQKTATLAPNNWLRLHPRQALTDSSVLTSNGSKASRYELDGPMAVALKLQIAIDAVRPVATTVRYGDRSDRMPPLLIPLAAPDSSSDGDFILDVQETVSDDADRRLAAELLFATETGGSQDFVLLGREPWTVKQFSMRRLGSEANAGSGTIADYDSDTQQWAFKAPEEPYSYVLPPMVTGDSADKPRRLEIHDRGPDDRHPGPFAADGNGLKRFAVESRFGPSTRLWVDPDDLDNKLIPAPWADHDLFRSRQVGGAGVALKGFRGEFLYGMPVGIDATGNVSRVRVSEIDAVVGEMPYPDLDDTVFQGPLDRRWAGLSEAYRQRPERLEFWQADSENLLAFAYARFTNGVDFALRHTALHRHPTSDEIEPTQNAAAPRLRYHPRGLSGGALWPIESANLARYIGDNPESDGGAIERIALSPMGGDADQAAKFLKRQVSIISETRAGFVQRQKVEVIGRIGVFWHRAKHVVVYERTVSPSEQFPAEGATRSRRPILRKVSEYVEILEPERVYPDFPDVAARSVGPLQAVRFNSRIIHVDSAWSEDLGNYGWRIPLWNHHSARQNPRIYPQPDVSFVTRAEGTAETATTAQECRNPDNIFFVADFETGGDRTDLWPPRPGVDFSLLPDPGLKIFEQRSKAGDDEKRVRNVTRIPTGFGRFTWRLATSGQRTQINANRASKPIFVDLESITFMRSVPATNTHAKHAAKLDKASQALGALGHGETERPRLPYWHKNADAPAGFEVVGVELTKLNEAVENKERLEEADKPLEELVAADKVIVEAKKALEKALSDFQNSPPADVASVARRINALIGSEASLLPDLAGLPSGKFCKKLETDISGTLRRKKLMLLDGIRGIQAETEAWIIATPGLTRETVGKDVETAVIKALEPLLSEASADIGRLGSGVQSARLIVADLHGDIQTSLERTLRRIDELNKSYDRAKPWSANRLDGFARKLDDLTSGIGDDINAALTEARQRLAGELEGLSAKLAAALSCELGRLVTTRDLLDDAIWNGAGRVREIAGELALKTDALTSADGPLAKAQAKIDDLMQKGPNATQKAILEKLSATLKTISGLAQTASISLESLAAKVDGTAASLSEVLVEAASIIATTLIGATNYGQALIDELANLNDEFFDDLDDLAAEVSSTLGSAQEWMTGEIARLARMGEQADRLVARVRGTAQRVIADVGAMETEAAAFIDRAAGDLIAAAKDVQDMLAPSAIVSTILRPMVIHPTLDAVFSRFPVEIMDETTRNTALAAVRSLAQEAENRLDGLEGATLPGTEAIADRCAALGSSLDDIYGQLEDVQEALKKKAKALVTDLSGLNDAEAIIAAINKTDRAVRALANDFGQSVDAAEAYSHRVVDALGSVSDGGASAFPNNVLRLYSAATSAPELGQLRANIDRMRMNFDALSDIIANTPAKAYLDRLGDELKAMGLSIPFDRIGETLLPSDLSNFDLNRLIPDFGGINLSKLFPGLKAPGALRDAIRISHDFDAKTKRAWVQIDVNVNLPQRAKLFSAGPFRMDFVDSRLNGFVRLEAAADTEQVSQSDHATLSTNLEALVSGQKMAGFEKLAIHYTKQDGTDVDFDPANIKLNDVLQFVQDTLGTIFPDRVGMLNIIKDRGIPIGFENEFSMPAISLNYATSGISNIQISNRFRLVAYPDFLIANRFNLSKQELPFIFSFFILGGTGYVQVDTEYRPFDGQLMVLVSAGAGASAAIGFAFGPVSGSVFITLSVVLSYRKLIGNDNSSSLSVGLSLVVAGNVDVCGIVSVYIGLMLDLTYRDNGQIDANGRLVLTIRISRFFKIRVRTEVQYKLRGGRSETVTRTTTGLTASDDVQKKLDKLKKATAALQ